MVEIVGLISGGKDSIYNLVECVRNGHTIVALANLKPPTKCEELDSFMYQTVGNNLIELIANECLELPLYQIEINGKAESKDENYIQSENDEVEDLFHLLERVKLNHPNVKGVSCGAILSTYQRIRVENVCSRLGFTSFTYLWMRCQDQLLQEMIESEINAVIIKVASMGLEPNKHLLKSIKQLYPILSSLNNKFGVHICGEGGEYESIVLDSPLYKKSIIIDEYSTIIHSDDAFSQVAYTSISKFSTLPKSPEEISRQSKFLQPNFINRNEKNLNEFIDSKLQDLPLIGEIELLVNNDSNYTNNCSFPEYGLHLSKNNQFFSISSTTSNNNIEGSSSTTSELLDKTLNSISKMLNENSLSMDQLLYCNLYLDDIKEFGNVNQVYYKYFKNNPASRACIQIPLNGIGNGNSNCNNTKFLIDCIGAINKKTNLHVQSISHWAPACIGPYSQANIYNGFTFLAGQIAMIPSNLDLVSSTTTTNQQLQLEINQILLNTSNLLKALNIDWENVIQSTIFVSDKIDISTCSTQIINYLDEFIGGTTGNKNLIQLYKIPNLPKNSNIEILFTLYKEPDNSQFELKYDDDNNDSQTNKSPTITSFELNNQFKNSNIRISSSNSFIHTQFNSSSSSSIDQLFKDLETITNLTSKSIVYIKFYYLNSTTEINQLQNNIHTNYKQYSKLLSFIPVLDIHSNNNNNDNNDKNNIACEIFIN